MTAHCPHGFSREHVECVSCLLAERDAAVKDRDAYAQEIAHAAIVTRDDAVRERDEARAERDQARGERERLRECLRDVIPVVRAFARENPPNMYQGRPNDPCGAHAALKFLDEIEEEYEERAARTGEKP